MADALQSLLSATADNGSRLIAVVPGSGDVTRAAVDAGADLLIALNAGHFRNCGNGSLAAYMPFSNANETTETLLCEHILPHAGSVPVIAGLCGPLDEPRARTYLDRLQALNIPAVTNWPAMGMIDGNFRAALEEDGKGTASEIETLRQAHELGFATVAFVYGKEDARRFADSGVDALILSLGVTRPIDDIREKRDLLQQAIARVNGMLSEVQKSGRKLPCLAYGGSVTNAEDVEQLFRLSGVDGFAGGSVFERLPLRDVTGSVVRRFKSAAVNLAQRSEAGGLGQMIGASAPMRQLFTLIKRIAPYDVNVCIEGPSGTGKELVATHIHRMSSRAHQPFVTLNCGAIPETLLESELFGHEKGAFTGAERRRLGKFELAHRGTLFLDEISTLSPHGQVALLRALQQREITRVGSESTIPVDVRVLAASNQNLVELVEQGGFRADLYHRLNQISIPVPALKTRLDDLPLLIDDIVRKLQIQLNRKFAGVSPRFMAKLQRNAWTGNVRELQHVILHAALCEDGPLLEGTHFVPVRDSILAEGVPGAGDRAGKDASWRQAVKRALRDANGNKSRAAATLGVTRKTLYAWIRELETADR
jgi:DNA-binding NtrC family response regulator/predicted TIM-barrel enzyme